MADKYYRLVCFVVDICADVMKYFAKLAKTDAGNTYTSVDAYLWHRKRDLKQLFNNKKLRGDQYDLLYPGNGTADENQWDVSILVILITELFATRLQPLKIFALKTEIREIWNVLQHHLNTFNISYDDMDGYWGRLDSSVKLIAKNALDPNDEASLLGKRNKVKCNHLPNLSDCLRILHEETSTQLLNIMNEVQANAEETTYILRQVTFQKPGPSGSLHFLWAENSDNGIYACSTINNVLLIEVSNTQTIRLTVNDGFESTMKELSVNFIPPNEMTDIQAKRRVSHNVVVTGCNNSRYFVTYLVAIKGMDFNYKQSVKMHTLSDWWHIDLEDGDLVLFRDPVSRYCYDESKAKSTDDISKITKYSTKAVNGNKTFGIVIVTDITRGFESTMKELSDNFIPPNEMTDIQAKLRVVETRCNNSRYFVTHLAAKKGMDFNYKQSVKMHTLSDWWHIDLEDGDLVLFRDPVSRYCYDESKAKSTDDISKITKCSTKAVNGNKTFGIVIVTDITRGFESTMKELSDNFIPPNEMTDIQAKLRVVETRCNNSRYFVTHLAAKKGMDFNYKQSVKMHTLSDWWHIDLEDGDLVLFRDPVSRYCYDESKAKSTDDISKITKCSTKAVNGNKTFGIVIVTDITRGFESTMKELSDNFIPPNEMTDIQAKLRVVETRCNNSRYFVTHLAAIKRMDFNYKQSVKMHTLSDWWHIDLEDGDLVLFRDPVSRYCYDESKAKSTDDISKITKYSTKAVGIVTDITRVTVLLRCMLWIIRKSVTEPMKENSRSDTEYNNFVRKDTSPHSCQICGVFPRNNEWLVCVRGKHMAKTYKLLECAEIVYESHELNIGEEPDKLTDEKDVIDINMSKKAFMPSVFEDILFESLVEESTDETGEDFNESFQMSKGEENDFEDNNFNDIDANTTGISNFLRKEINRNDLGKPSVRCIAEIEEMENGQEEVSILIPQETPFHFGQSQPLDDNTSYNMPAVGKETRVSKKKIRMQVVPNQFKLTEEQPDVKTVAQNACSYSLGMYSSNDTFFNLKYKLKSEKSYKKKIDCTLQEEDFDQMMLLRRTTWLPIDQLPVPEIDLTVAHLTNFEPIMEIIDLIAAGTPPTPHISMRYELLRFCTLRSYPKEDKPFLIKLSEAGFYYASDGDGVVCYCCGIRRYNWTAEDNPRKIHERINPSCKFLRKNEEVNVPVQYFGPYSKELMAIMEIPEPIERPQVSEDVNNDWAPERIRTPASQQPNRPNESGTNALGINTAIPKHSQYATKTAREASYSTWPDTSSHTPEVLADAGFFYAGFGDCVRCFYCGIGLRHWTAEDDPWIEHARWSKNCVFVKQKKGEEFVNLVQLAVQYSQDNEANPSGQNQLQSQEIERLLLSDAAQSVLEMGYQPRLIKKSIEEILKQNGDTNITAQLLMEKVLEIEESENRSQSAPQATATITSSATAAQATATTTTTNTATAVQVKTGTGKPEITKHEESKEATTKSKAEKKPGKFDASKENKSKEKKEDKGKEDKDESQEDPKAIKKENEELKEQTLCKVCLDNTVCIVFLPCGHLVTCADCAPAMRKCPICRALVKGTVRTYMS